MLTADYASRGGAYAVLGAFCGKPEPGFFVPAWEGRFSQPNNAAQKRAEFMCWENCGVEQSGTEQF
jgi:hypothetical protein